MLMRIKQFSDKGLMSRGDYAAVTVRVIRNPLRGGLTSCGAQDFECRCSIHIEHHAVEGRRFYV